MASLVYEQYNTSWLTGRQVNDDGYVPIISTLCGKTNNQFDFAKNDQLNFLASSKNFARPISVNGCFNNARMDSNGEVITSAPNSAALII